MTESNRIGHLYFGDSIMGRVPNEGYTQLLAAEIYKIDPKTRHHFLHIGGNSSSDLLKRIDSECVAREKSRAIKRIFLSVGIVDSSYVDGQPAVHIDTYSENVGAILGIAKSHAEIIIVPGLTRVDQNRTQPFTKGSSRIYNNQRISCFDEILETSCKSLNGGGRVKYISLYDVLSPDDLADGIHPNKQGHEKIFRKLLEA